MEHWQWLPATGSQQTADSAPATRSRQSAPRPSPTDQQSATGTQATNTAPTGTQLTGYPATGYPATSHPSTSPQDLTSNIAEMVAAVIRMAGKACEDEHVQPTTEKFANVVALAYLDAAQRGQARPEHVKQLVRLMK